MSDARSLLNWRAETAKNEILTGPGEGPFSSIVDGHDIWRLELIEGLHVVCSITLNGLVYMLNRDLMRMEAERVGIHLSETMARPVRRRLKYSLAMSCVINKNEHKIEGQQITLVQEFVREKDGAEVKYESGFVYRPLTGLLERVSYPALGTFMEGLLGDTGRVRETCSAHGEPRL